MPPAAPVNMRTILPHSHEPRGNAGVHFRFGFILVTLTTFPVLS